MSTAVARKSGMRLPPLEELRAAEVGFQRARIAVEAGRTPRHRGGSIWGGHIEGACAELLVARWTVRPWTGEEIWTTPPPERLPDVGEKIEVRWTAPGPPPTLYLDAERDKPDRFYVLVTGYAPEYDILGYIQGAEGMRSEWLHRYPERAVYRVPADALRYLPPG